MRDIGLDANAGHRRSVRIQTKREQKCRKRNAHIKVTQNGLKLKHQTMKLFKTGILPAVAYGHAGMGMCPSSIQHKRAMAGRFVWEKKRDRVHCDNLALPLWRERRPSYLVFRWISFELGLSFKAKKWCTDWEELTSPVRGLLLLLV